jgi:ubiquinone/menaquinone biosynthesis C-methylase UbiE
MTTVPKKFRPALNNAYYFIRNALYKKIVEHAPALQGRLMDFGCGSKPYQSLFVNVSEYIGVDYASEGHSHAQENIDVMYDGKKLPFSDEHFDSVFSSEVFEHVFNLEEMIPEIKRVMKRGGKVLIYQMRMVYFNDHFIPSFPLLGKLKFFRTNIPPLLNPVLNTWFSFWHWILPKRKDLYLNNILVAEKI